MLLMLPSLAGCVTHQCAQHWLMHPEPAGIRNYVTGLEPVHEMWLATTAAKDLPSSATLHAVASDDDAGEIRPAVHHRLEVVPSAP